jgi:hypothetical protein
VRPEAKTGGYVDPKLTQTGIAPQPQNTAQGNLSITVVADTIVKQNHIYQLTFKDSVNADRFRATASYSLKDLSDNTIIITDEPLPTADDEQKLVLAQDSSLILLSCCITDSASVLLVVNFGGWTGLIPELQLVPFTGFGTLVLFRRL